MKHLAPPIHGKPYTSSGLKSIGRVHTITVHYSATYPEDQTSVVDIDKMHRNRKYSCIGYHYFINIWGHVWAGRDVTRQGAHVKSHNPGNIGICYAGGVLKASGPNVGVKTLNDAQEASLIQLIHWLLDQYPNARVVGHKDLGATQCPGFDVQSWWANVLANETKPKPPVQKHTDIQPTKPSESEPVGDGGWFIRFLKKLFNF